MNAFETKAAKVEAILEAKGFAWTMDLADAVRDELRVCDGKDTPSKIAARLVKRMSANA